MPAPNAGIRIRGLRDFQRGLQKADKRLAAFVRTGLRGLAEPVADRARSLAAQRTTRRTGDLLGGIEAFARQGVVGVRSKAIHDGYAYPKRIEFEGGFPYGPRASLYPAAQEAAKDGERLAEGVLTQIEHDLAGRGLS